MAREATERAPMVARAGAVRATIPGIEIYRAGCAEIRASDRPLDRAVVSRRAPDAQRPAARRHTRHRTSHTRHRTSDGSAGRRLGRRDTRPRVADQPKAGSDEAFIEEHRGFVVSRATQLKNELNLFSVNVDDLIAFGFQGLLEARSRFDASLGLGAKFTTFAHYRVRGAMIDGVRKMSHLPSTVYRLRKAAEAADQILEEGGEEAAAAAAAAVGTTVEQTIDRIDDVLGRITASFVIAAVGQDEDSQRRDASDLLIEKEAHQRVQRALSALPERELVVIKGMYFEERSLDDIGAQLGVSRSWACRIHTKGLKIMRKALEAEERKKR